MFDACVLLLSLCSDVYKLNSIISSFQQFLENLYKPLFEVTIDPRLHPELHVFLQYVSSWCSKYCEVFFPL